MRRWVQISVVAVFLCGSGAIFAHAEGNLAPHDREWDVAAALPIDVGKKVSVDLGARVKAETDAIVQQASEKQSGRDLLHFEQNLAKSREISKRVDRQLAASIREAPVEVSRSRWGADYFPNTPLVTHEGKAVRFFDDLIEDKVVVINFIYASCPDSCPMDTAKLAKVHQILGDRVGRDIFMYSITIDPEQDTPEVLAEYAKRFRAGPGWWFLTGDEADILLLRKKLGLYIAGLDKESKDHNMSFLIGNQRTGQWIKRSPMDNPYFIADQIGSWLSNWETPSALTNPDYAHAPELQVPTMGENLFKTRCSVCHTIGTESVRTVGGLESIERNQRRMGPDLLHVVHRRDRAWLARWLADPEKMLAEKDAIAMQLYSEWGEVLMPNLRLNEVEVNALIEYVDAESRRVQQNIPIDSIAGVHPPGHHQH